MLAPLGKGGQITCSTGQEDSACRFGCETELQSGAGQEIGHAWGQRRGHLSHMLVLQRTDMHGTTRQARHPLWHPKQYLGGEGSPIRAGQDMAAHQGVPKAGLAGVAKHSPR